MYSLMLLTRLPLLILTLLKHEKDDGPKKENMYRRISCVKERNPHRGALHREFCLQLPQLGLFVVLLDSAWTCADVVSNQLE